MVETFCRTVVPTDYHAQICLCKSVQFYDYNALSLICIELKHFVNLLTWNYKSVILLLILCYVFKLPLLSFLPLWFPFKIKNHDIAENMKTFISGHHKVEVWRPIQTSNVWFIMGL